MQKKSWKNGKTKRRKKQVKVQKSKIHVQEILGHRYNGNAIEFNVMLPKTEEVIWLKRSDIRNSQLTNEYMEKWKNKRYNLRKRYFKDKK